MGRKWFCCTSQFGDLEEVGEARARRPRLDRFDEGSIAALDVVWERWGSVVVLMAFYRCTARIGMLNVYCSF